MLDFKKRAAVFRGFIVVAIALFAQLQCAVACATQACNTDSAQTSHVPPCHRHQDQTHGKAPGSCSHQNVVGPAASPQMQLEIPIGSVVSPVAIVPARIPAGSRQNSTNHSALSPPGHERLSSVVLRV
jgi:hypothetical protein